MQAEKSKIEKYLKLHDIESCLDVVLNEVIEKRPTNPFKALSVLLETKSCSEILQVKLSTIICENGNLGVQCTVYTNISNYSGTMGFPYKIQQNLNLHMEDEEDKVLHILKGQDPNDMKHIELQIMKHHDLHKSIKLAMTMACLRAAAGHKCQPLYIYLTQYFESSYTTPSSIIQPLQLPKPCINVINCVHPNNSLNITHQSLSILPGISNLELFILFARRITLKLASKLEGEKNTSLIQSKNGTNTYAVTGVNITAASSSNNGTNSTTALGTAAVSKEEKDAAAKKSKETAAETKKAAAGAKDAKKKGGGVDAAAVTATAGAKSTDATTAVTVAVQTVSPLTCWIKLLDELIQGDSENTSDVGIAVDLRNYSQTMSNTSNTAKTDGDMSQFLIDVIQSITHTAGSSSSSSSVQQHQRISTSICQVNDACAVTNLSLFPAAFTTAIEKTNKHNTVASDPADTATTTTTAVIDHHHHHRVDFAVVMNTSTRLGNDVNIITTTNVNAASHTAADKMDARLDEPSQLTTTTINSSTANNHGIGDANNGGSLMDDNHDDDDDGMKGNEKDQILHQQLDKINHHILINQQLIINRVRININDIGCIFTTVKLILQAKESSRFVTLNCTSNELYPETADSFITDLAVALSVDQLEGGGLTQCEYSAKYNRLVAIQKELLI